MFKKATNILDTVRKIATEVTVGFIDGLMNPDKTVTYIESDRDLYVSLRAQLELVEHLAYQFNSQKCTLENAEEIIGWTDFQDEVHYECFHKKNELLRKLSELGIEINPNKSNYLKFNK